VSGFAKLMGVSEKLATLNVDWIFLIIPDPAASICKEAL
jgi:hypothetical protein